MSVMNRFYTTDVVENDDFKFSPGGQYFAPVDGPYESYLEYIRLDLRPKKHDKITWTYVYKFPSNCRHSSDFGVRYLRNGKSDFCPFFVSFFKI